MKLKDCYIHKGLTIKIDRTNYHKVEVGMTAVFDETDDYEAGVAKLTAMVNSKLAAEINSALELAAENEKEKTTKRQTLMEKKDG